MKQGLVATKDTERTLRGSLALREPYVEAWLSENPAWKPGSQRTLRASLALREPRAEARLS